jgi:hypothetical protein
VADDHGQLGQLPRRESVRARGLTGIFSEKASKSAMKIFFFSLIFYSFLERITDPERGHRVRFIDTIDARKKLVKHKNIDGSKTRGFEAKSENNLKNKNNYS